MNTSNKPIKYERWACVKSVHIQSFSGPYSVQMRENTDQKNSESDTFHAEEIKMNNWHFLEVVCESEISKL